MMSALHTGGRGGLKLVAWPIALVVGAVGAAAWSTPPAAPDTFAAGRGPKAMPVGTYAVGRLERTFVDDSRPTKAKQGFEGAPNRTLHTTIYYPARGKTSDVVTPHAAPDRKHGPDPMILYSHGHDSFGAEFEPLLRQWTSAGYVIAAPDYPLSNKNAPGGADGSDLGEQPADARFVIDRMLASSTKRSGQLSHLVDANDIGASGHSLGALTTYRLVYETCCADKRVKAAAPMSGVAGGPPEFFTGISTPLLAEHGDADGTIARQAGAPTFANASPPKVLPHADRRCAHPAVSRCARSGAYRGCARNLGLLRPLPEERSGCARAAAPRCRPARRGDASGASAVTGGMNGGGR
jgi:dienelactone hydrolase